MVILFGIYGGQKSTTEYDSHGRISKTKDFNGNEISYSYDSVGHLDIDDIREPLIN